MEIKNQDNISKIIGEVDIATAKDFENGILELVNAGLPVIKLDLTDMDYIDSTGIGILMNIKKNILKDDQEIILINPKRSIKKLFELTGANQVFKIEM